MALEYGINFNSEEGRKKAEEEIKKWRANLQKYFDKNPINIGLGEGGGQSKTKTATAQLQGYRKELQELRNEYKKLTTEELKSGKGKEIVDKYRQLRNEVGIYGGTLDQAVKAEDRIRASHRKTTQEVDKQTKAYRKQSEVLSQLRIYAMNFLSVYAGIRVMKNLVDITGQFELQRVSLKAILQDGEKAATLYEQIKDLAVMSPFQFKELVTYTKQLSAFSVPYKELFDTTKMLADVSAGLGVSMDRLIIAYGQVRSAAVLRGQELRQFTEAGIPLVEELSKRLSETEGKFVSMGEVFEYISARKVPFEMVRDVLFDMAKEGGKFFEMQEKQAATVAGKISNLKDAYQIMFSEIGTQQEGLIKGSIDAVRSLIVNYETVGRVIISLAATYGIYRTAIVANTLAEKSAAAVRLSHIKITHALRAAQAALNKVMLMNPYVLVAAGVALLAVGMWNLNKALDASKKAQEAFNKQQQEHIEDLENERNEIERLIDLIKDETQTRAAKQRALSALQSMYPGIFNNMDIESVKLMELTDIMKLYNAEIERNEALRQRQTIAEAEELMRQGFGELETPTPEQADRRRAAMRMMGMSPNILRVVGFNNLKLDERFAEYVKLLKAAEDERLINEFNAKTDQERVVYVDQRIEALKKEKAELEKQQKTQFGGLMPAEWQRTPEKVQLEIDKLVKQRQDLLSTNQKEIVTSDSLIEKYNRLTEAIKTQQEQLKKGLVDEDSVRELQEQRDKVEESLSLMGIDMSKKEAPAKADKEQDAMRKASEKLIELRAKLALEEKKYELEARQDIIDSKEEGVEKELAQIEITKERELLAIEERKQAMIDANREIAIAQLEEQGKEGILTEEIKLTKNQSDILASMTEAANMRELRSRELLLQNMLSDYRDYAKQIEDIEAAKNKKIAEFEALRTKDNSAAIDRAIAEVKKKAGEEVAAVTFDELKTTDSWRILFSDLENYTIETLKKSLEEVEKTDISKLSPTDAKAVQQAIDKMRQKIDEKNPFFALKDGWEEFIKATEQEKPDSAMDALNRMINGAQKLLSYYDEFSALMGATTGEESDASFWTNTVGDIMGANISTGSGIAKILMGDVRGVKDVVQGLTSYVNVFRKIRNRKYDKEIERQQEIVENLRKEYDKLSKAAEDALGADYYKNSQKEAENLRKQAEAINKQIEAEKKKGKDADEDRIKELEQTRDELLEESVTVVEDALDKLTGTDLTSAAEQFAQAWMDAYVSFGDTTEAIKQQFNDMMKDMIVNAMLSKVMQQWLDPVFKMIEKAWEDGYMSSREIANVWEFGEQQMAGANKALEGITKGLEEQGVDLREKETNLTGISKGISTITEDTALVLGGYLNSIRYMLGEYFKFAMSPENKTTAAMLIQLQTDAITHLQAISLNTSATAMSNAAILDNINKMMVSTATGWKLKVEA